MGHITPFAPRILRGYPSVVEALDGPEKLLLSGLRGWVADLRQATDPLPRLQAAMAAAGVPEAAASLDMVMRVIARTAKRPVALACPHCPRLAPDEQRLLHAARLAQGREAWLAEEVLREGLLSAEGASFIRGPLEGFGRLFAAAGLRLRRRSLLEPADVVPGPEIAPWIRPLPGLH